MKKIFIVLTLAIALILPSLSIKAVEVPSAQLVNVNSFTWTYQTTISSNVLFRSNKVNISDIQIINITTGNAYGTHESAYFSTPQIRYFNNFADTTPALVVSSFDLNTWQDISSYGYNWYDLQVTTVIASGQSEAEARAVFLSSNEIKAIMITEGVLISVDAVQQAFENGMQAGQAQAYDDGYKDARAYYSEFIDGVWQTAIQTYNRGYADGSEAFTAWVALFSIVPQMFGALFSIEILPGLYTGYIAGLSIILGLIGFFFAFKKGKS